jgi:hypothetical protein
MSWKHTNNEYLTHQRFPRLYLYHATPITTNEYSLGTRDLSTFVHLLHHTRTICNPSLPY